jgi:hypothetical protein
MSEPTVSDGPGLDAPSETAPTNTSPEEAPETPDVPVAQPDVPPEPDHVPTLDSPLSEGDEVAPGSPASLLPDGAYLSPGE